MTTAKQKPAKPAKTAKPAKPAKQTAIAYLRVSTDKQDAEMQLHEIKTFASKNNLKLTTVEDTASGTINWKLRELGAALDKAEEQNSLLIMSEVSRVARSTLQVLEFIAECARRKIQVHFIKQGLAVDESLQSKAMLTLFSLFSELERDLISMRTKEALAKKRSEGIQLGRPEGLTPAQARIEARHKELERYMSAGLPLTGIAKLMNVSRGTLYTYATKSKLLTKKHRRN